jgi:hypothetical protein
MRNVAMLPICTCKNYKKIHLSFTLIHSLTLGALSPRRPFNVAQLLGWSQGFVPET